MYTPLNSFVINVFMRWPLVAVTVAACSAWAYAYARIVA
jgi:hypothetical protein